MSAAAPRPPDIARALALLWLLGAGWGLTVPLIKIAVSGGHGPLGLVFWQLAISVAVLGAITALRRRRFGIGPRRLRLFAVVALTGTLVPNAASYQAAAHLPAGVLAILLSLVPMFAFPIALALGRDRFAPARLAGLLAGLAGVVLLVGPRAGLPDPGMVAWIPLALVAPLFYALEGNLVALWGRDGLDPVQVLLGASVVGLALALPLALAGGQFVDPRPPWGAPEAALAAAGVIHALVYAGYVHLVGRAGAVFAAQVSYLVTGFGVLWAMVLLAESYSGWVWAALALMFAGLFLVQPRAPDAAPEAAPAPDAAPVPDPPRAPGAPR